MLKILENEMLLWVLVTAATTVACIGKMEVLYSWKTPDFTFPSNEVRESYVSSGKFIPGQNVLIDVDMWTDGDQDPKVIVTLPKFKPGTPVTLASVTNQNYKNTTLLAPYPDWSWHNEGDCEGISSVFRTAIDTCGKLWVIDSGVIDIFGANTQICPPQILVFDLKTDELVDRYRVPDRILDRDSLLVTIAVDTRDTLCENTYAYIADVRGNKLIVFDAKKKKSWRVASILFFPYPPQGIFNMNGVTFDLMDGLFGLALGPVVNGDRRLYFHSLASIRESWVNTSVLQNSSLFENALFPTPRSFSVFEGTRDSQSASEAMSENGILFFGLLNKNSIACWKSTLPYGQNSFGIAAQDETTLRFPSGIKIYNKDFLITLSSTFENWMVNNVPENEVNYRILIGRISDLVRNTHCDSSVRTVNGYGARAQTGNSGGMPTGYGGRRF